MTIEARINYQKGKTENKNIEAYNYTIESDLDRFIVNREEAKRRILNQNQEAELESFIETTIEKTIDDLLSSL